MGGVWERRIRNSRTILDDLFKTLSCGLNNFKALLAETEGIINSRSLLAARFHSHLVTYSHRKPMPLYHLLVTLIDQTCTKDADGDKFNISLGNFGHVEEMNFFRAFRFDKNGIKENEALILVT